MDIEIFIISVLSVWRITKIINEEEGPFSIFLKIRAAAPTDGKNGWIGRGLYCFWCVSFWLGVSSGLTLARTPVLLSVLYGVAISTIAIMVDYIYEIIGRHARNP